MLKMNLSAIFNNPDDIILKLYKSTRAFDAFRLFTVLCMFYKAGGASSGKNPICTLSV
jgi:hypothetical protein